MRGGEEENVEYIGGEEGEGDYDWDGKLAHVGHHHIGVLARRGSAVQPIDIELTHPRHSADTHAGCDPLVPLIEGEGGGAAGVQELKQVESQLPILEHANVERSKEIQTILLFNEYR